MCFRFLIYLLPFSHLKKVFYSFIFCLYYDLFVLNSQSLISNPYFLPCWNSTLITPFIKLGRQDKEINNGVCHYISHFCTYSYYLQTFRIFAFSLIFAFNFVQINKYCFILFYLIYTSIDYSVKLYLLNHNQSLIFGISFSILFPKYLIMFLNFITRMFCSVVFSLLNI
jgi:hypothetical protein